MQVLAQVLEMAVRGLEVRALAPDAARTIVEASISTLQALISLIDESSSKGVGASAGVSPSRSLQQLSVECHCVEWVSRVGCACIPAISRLHVRPPSPLPDRPEREACR